MSSNKIDIGAQYANNPGLKQQDVQTLQEWMKMQPHLPEISELQMILFLHSCHYSNEATKKCIDNYYTARHICPEFFANRNPAVADMQKCMKSIAMTPLPKNTPDGSIIYYHKLIDLSADKYNFIAIIKLFDMVASFSLQEQGAVQGHIILINMEGFTLQHLLKFNPVALKKYMYFLQEALPFRLKGFHYVNAVSFMDKVLAIIKPFMKKDLLDVLHIHTGNNETLNKFIPKECLPCEIGGTCGDSEQIHENYMKKLEDNAKYFADEEKFVADESKRMGKPRDANELFGVEGTFKKLDID